ncbi:MAG: leucine-rich repeat domain-containing protein [Planctomycetota bacterium]|jgi:Leucine-rich repeat (LRR) protein
MLKKNWPLQEVLNGMKLCVNNTTVSSQKELDRFFENAWSDCMWQLDLSGNGLEELDMELAINILTLDSLRDLDLSDNHLTTLPGYFSDLRACLELNLQRNPLIDPPPQIVQKGGAAVCQYLSQPLSQKALSAIFTEAGRRSSKTLDLSGRKIRQIPAEIGRATDLEVLKLNNNELCSLPPEIEDLHRLRRIELLGNHISEFPKVLLSLNRLRSLGLQSNRLTRIPDLTALSGLQHLDLCANELEVLPESLGNLSGLEILEVMFNRLTGLPESIGQLKDLRRLELDFNRIEYLPQSITCLRNLRALNLFENRLTSLPDSIGQLKDLQRLDLNANRIERLPASITQLGKLRSLHLFENRLTSLPDDFDDLTALSELDLRKNDLYDAFRFYGFFRKIDAMF